MAIPIEYKKSQLLKNKSVTEIKENLSVGDVVCYYLREDSSPLYRFGVIQSFTKRSNTEIVVIKTIRSDFSTFDNNVEISRHNFIIDVSMDAVYAYWTDRIEKQIEELKRELKLGQQKLRSLKKSSHSSKRRFKELVDSLQN